MDKVAQAAGRLGVGTLLVKLDVRSAYRLIPVHPDDCPLLGFQWQGVQYVDGMLPFGLRSAPKIFATVADALEWVACQRGVPEIDHYLDDFVTLGPHATADCQKNLDIIIQTCVDLGIPLALEKLTMESADNSLHHLFKSIKPTPEQIQDLMNFRKVGQMEFDRRVQYYTLSNPSVRPPKRRKRLLTFTERKSRKKRVSEIERERKLQIECWKKRVAFASTGTQLSHAYEQCIELPRALVTCDGHLNKGSKANTTTVYAKRYENTTPSIITTSFPPGWVPSTVIIEGMFLINISPWNAHTNMGEYGDFLLKQHILLHFRNGTTEVHLLFDHPECQAHSPKYFERKHRDSSNPIPADHYCDNFTADMLIPTKWRQNVLGCRKCKRELVCFLSHHLVDHIGQHL